MIGEINPREEGRKKEKPELEYSGHGGREQDGDIQEGDDGQPPGVIRELVEEEEDTGVDTQRQVAGAQLL